MNRFAFLVIVFTLLVFSSSSYAESFEVKSISGTEFTLLSNTDQCLSNCVSWIEWDLSKGIVSNVQLPSEKNSQFGFDIVKETEEIKDLTSFGIDVWKEKATVIQDFRNEEEVYEVSLFDLKGLDANTQGFFCESFGCTEKVKDVCNCTRTISVPNGSHTDYAWEKIADDFYGFKAIQGNIYRLRVWGNRKAELGSNGVDWIPTFFGETITEWDWWLSGWDSKFAINSMVVGKDQNSTNWVNLIAVDFSALNSDCADASDIRIVNETTGTEVSDLNFKGWDGTNTDADVDVLFKLTESLVADTYNGEYYIYSNNDSCPAATNRVVDQSAFDDFENDNYDLITSAPVWTQEGAVSSSASTEAVAAKFGNFGLQVVSVGASSWRYQVIGGFSNATYNVCGWVRTDDVTAAYAGFQGDLGNTFEFAIVSNDFYAYTNDDTIYTAWTATPANDTWYKLCVVKNASTETFFIYDNAEAFIESWPHAAGGDTLTSVAIRQGASITAWYDNVGFTPPNEPTYVLGVEENSSIRDLNITTINGISFLTHPIFAYGISGNITVDFNVFHNDNNRITIDLNYSPSIIQGSGTVIVKDLNLTSEYCPDQDWDDVPSKCSYSWNFSAADDGNYAIIGLMNDSAQTDFNTSDGNFEISNDVNLQINVPIDEDTGLALDMVSEYFYNVKVLDGNTITEYKNNTDFNFFQIPVTDKYFIIITIDTNVSADYYGRSYYVKFPTVMTTSVLQPYLVPVTGGIEAIFYTKNAVDLQVIPNILIKSFKVLSGVGRTEVERVETDSAGTGVLTFVEGDSYELEIYDADGMFLFTEAIVANFTSYYIYLGGEEIIWTEPDIEYITILGVPNNRKIPYGSAGYDLNIDVNVIGGTIVTAWYTVRNDDGNLYFDMNNFTDFNVTLSRENVENQMEIRLIVYVVSASGLTLEKHYGFIPYDESGYNLIVGLSGSGLRQEFACSVDPNEPCFFLLMLAAFITIAVIASAGVGITTDMNSLGILAMICLALFTYLTWIPTGFFILACLAAFAGLVLSRRGF